VSTALAAKRDFPTPITYHLSLHLSRLSAAAALLASFAATAQDFPTRPIRMFIPFPAGQLNYASSGVISKLHRSLAATLVNPELREQLTTSESGLSSGFEMTKSWD
jgi:hypothetical protein